MGKYWPERRFWEVLVKNDQESARHKERLDYNREVFQGNLRQIGGFRELLKYYVAFGKEQVDMWPAHFQGLSRLHRRAAALLVRYGVEYRPYAWTEPPQIEPDIGSCYVNSFRYMAAMNHAFRSNASPHRLAYAEGVVLGQSTNIHAWNALDTTSDLAIDTTLYAMSGWYFYLGIPLAEHEYRNARRIAHPDGRCNLLRRDVFPRVEGYLERVLSAR